MHDRTIEDRVRSTLRAEAEELPFSVTVDELERRLTLRQRGRAGRRRGLLAAAVAAIVVAGALLVASNPFRATQVATTPEPTTGPTAAPTISATAAASVDPTSSSSVDPVSLLAALEPSADAVDSKVTTQPGDPTSTDTEPGGLGLDHVRQNAREVGIKVVCLGPDQLYVSWEVVQRDDPTRIADQLIPCDNSVASFRYDISARQPLIDDALIVFATPRTSYRVLVETFGSTNVPTPVGLPGLATPGGTTLAEASETLGSSAATTTKVGTVPVRALYRVAMVCNETQPATSKPARATWSIGRIGTGGLVDQATIPCDGAPYGVSSSAGLASGDRDVYVTADPHTVWRIALTDPYGPIGFIPPP